MPAITRFGSRGSAFALTATTVELTLVTAYIHLSLGGVLFTLNALPSARKTLRVRPSVMTRVSQASCSEKNSLT